MTLIQKVTSSLFAFAAAISLAAEPIDITALVRTAGPECYSWTSSYGNRYADRNLLPGAIDGNVSSSFQTDKGVSPGAGYFRYTISKDWSPAKVIIPTSYSLNFGQVYYPSAWSFLGYNEDTQVWDVLNTGSIAAGQKNPTFTGEIDTSNLYRDFKIEISSLNSPPYIYFNEFILSGLAVVNENLCVSGSPGLYGDVSPAYGNYFDREPGATLTATASGEWMNAEETIKTYCLGYTLSNVVENAETGEVSYRHVETSSDNSLDYTHPADAGAKLTWLWDCRYLSRFSATEAAEGVPSGTVTVTKNGEPVVGKQYFADGTVLHVEVVADANSRFIGWEGAIDEAKRYSSSFDYVVNGNYTDCTASFVAIADPGLTVYVGPNGNDEELGLLVARPKATVAAAYAAVSQALDALQGENAKGEIRILPGVNTMGEVSFVTLDKAVTVRGWNGSREECVIKAATTGNRRHFVISSPDAVVRDLTLTDGYFNTTVGGSDNGKNNPEDGGSIQMSAGLVQNCIIRDSISRYNGGGIAMRGNPDNPPTVLDCVITNCMGYRHGVRGLGLSMAGGTDGNAEKPIAAIVERTKLINCRNVDTASYGFSVVYMALSGAVLRDCVISGTKYHRTDFTYKGGGVYMSAGLVERCVITNMVRSDVSIGPHQGAGVYMTGGLLHNCLIIGNEALKFGGGVYATGGTLLNNTIAGNECVDNSYGGLYVEGSSAVVINNIISDNQAGSSFIQRNFGTSSTGATSFVDYNDIIPPDALSSTYINSSKVGTHNVTTLPGFVDIVNKDISLLPASPCIDSGATIDTLATSGVLSASTLSSLPFLNAKFNTDISANAGSRPLQGLETSGTALPDIGCYEADDYRNAPFSCSFTADPALALIEIPLEKRDGSQEVVDELQERVTCFLTAKLVGGNIPTSAHTDGTMSFTWTITDAQGNVVGEPIVRNTNTATVELGIGLYSVSLIVNSISDGALSAEYSISDVVKIVSQTVYVDANGANIPPFASWETAAHYVEDAVGTLLPSIPLEEGRHQCLVAEGRYRIKSNQINIVNNIDLIGVEGKEKTILEAYGADPETEAAVEPRRILMLDSEGAMVCGFTLTGGFAITDLAGAGTINNGLIKDCIIKGNATKEGAANSGSVAGLRVTGGVVEDCIFTENAPGYASAHNALQLSGGMVNNCRIENNNLGRGRIGVVTVSGGVLTNSVIANNIPTGDWEPYTQQSAGLYQNGGSVINCIIANNIAVHPKGGICSGAYVNSGLLRQCLIAGNSAQYADGSAYTCRTSGLYQRGGIVENCTIVNNGVNLERTIGVHLDSESAVFRNNIVADNYSTNMLFSSSVAASIVTNTLIYAGVNSDQTYRYGPHESVLRTKGAGNVLSDPLFGNDYQLKPGSPCVNKALFQPWMEGVLDLGGKRRKRGKSIDMGAYECQKSNGTALTVK